PGSGGDPARRERRPRGAACVETGDRDQQRHDDDPSADAEERAEDTGDEADREQAHHSSYRMAVAAEDLLARFAESPGEAAIMLDVDGTLAPIVARPELATVPEETRAELRRLVARYALVACISGRTGEDGARVVGVEGRVYVGVHGLEPAPEAGRGRGPLRGFGEGGGWPLEAK